MVELLTTPPREVPPDAAAEMRAGERELDRTRSRAGAIVIGLWGLITVIGPWLAGIGNGRELAIAASTIAIAFVMSLVRMYRPRRDGFIPTYHLIGISAAVAGVGIGLGPVYITPMLAVVFISVCNLSIDSSRRLLPFAAGCIAVALPYVLEWTHVMSPSLVERGDLLCIVPRMSRIPATAGVGQCLIALACVGIGGLYMLRFRAALTDMQRRNSINAWQLRQLVPRTSSEASPS
jgi:hypothetical protein